jgi:outer membrane protein
MSADSMRVRRSFSRVWPVALLAGPGLAWAQVSPPAGEAAAPAAESPASAVSADEPAASPPPAPYLRTQIGMALETRPTYLGSPNRETKLRPVLGLQYGRFRLSSSRASLVESSGGGGQLSGASVDLSPRGPWSLNAALRIDHGRGAGDDPLLAGLPEVRQTVRGRVSARYTITPSWSAGASVSTDLLGRKGGTLGALDVGWSTMLTPAWRWTLGGGLGLADATYMRSYHGISPEVAAATSRTAYVPGAGMHGVGVSTGLTWNVSPAWRLGATGAFGRLTGPAVDSPLTQARNNWSVSVGAVWVKDWRD